MLCRTFSYAAAAAGSVIKMATSAAMTKTMQAVQAKMVGTSWKEPVSIRTKKTNEMITVSPRLISAITENETPTEETIYFVVASSNLQHPLMCSSMDEIEYVLENLKNIAAAQKAECRRIDTMYKTVIAPKMQKFDMMKRVWRTIIASWKKASQPLGLYIQTHVKQISELCAITEKEVLEMVELYSICSEYASAYFEMYDKMPDLNYRY